MSIEIENSWKNLLDEEFQKSYFSEIRDFLKSEIESGKTIYPHPKNIFAAFNTTPVENVKVVILGQDPYHREGQAMGLSFSVPDGIKIPPSLRNIYKEIEAEGYTLQNRSPGIQGELSEGNEDGGVTTQSPLIKEVGSTGLNGGIQENDGHISGNLTHWAKQGVLLLNSILTVEAGKPASHSKIGWENFTDTVIQKISDEKEAIVFLLWGNFAQGKKYLIDTSKHLVLEAPHPSPFSAYNGFFGNGHFIQTNQYLKQQGRKEIHW